LKDFKKTVLFVLETPNPSTEPLADSEFDAEQQAARERSAVMMNRECGTLLSEIERLEKSIGMHDMRLKNVMDLSFRIVNIEDSRRMQELTEAAVRDSAAIKQISYLTMFFLPSSFVATAFGMNVKEINPESLGKVSQYIAIAVALTAITIWVIVAYQIQIKEPEPSGDESSDNLSSYSYFAFGGGGQDKRPFRHLNLWARLSWPVVLISTLIERRRRLDDRRAPTRIYTS